MRTAFVILSLFVASNLWAQGDANESFKVYVTSAQALTPNEPGGTWAKVTADTPVANLGKEVIGISLGFFK